MKKSFVPFIILLMLLPLASAAELNCQRAISPDPVVMYCNLTGTGNVSVRVVAFDSVNVSCGMNCGFWDAIFDGRREHDISVSLGDFLALGHNSTAEFEIFIGSIITDALSKIGLDSAQNWVFNGRTNYVTFEIVHANGTVERIKVAVFIKGGPYLPIPSHGRAREAVLFAALLLAVGAVMWMRKRAVEQETSDGGSNRLRDRSYIPSRWNYLERVFLLMWVATLVSAWVLYYLGTPTRYYGDYRLFFSEVPLLALTLGFLVDWSELRLLDKLYLLRNPPITGVEWMPLSAVVFGWRYFIAGWILFGLFLVLNRDERLNRLMRLAGLASPLWAFYLVETFGGDPVFKYSLTALVVIHVALINSVVMNAPEKVGRSPDVEELVKTFERALR